MLRRTAALVGVGLVAGGTSYLVWGEGSDSGGDGAAAREVSPQTRSVVRGMSLEEKVDQVMAIGFEGTDSSSPIVAEVGERELGAVFVRGENWIDAAQLQALVSAIRAAGSGDGRQPPLLIAEQAGGLDRSFPDLPPGRRQVAVAATVSLQVAERWGAELARGLRDAGFDLNLGPVADVATIANPNADRTFGDDPEIVADLTAAATRGCRAEELACAPAHFPGIGSTTGDTDLGPASVSVDADTLIARDVQPFLAAFGAGAPAVVLSLAFYAAFDPVTPAALSSAVATGLLRDQLGFAGLAISDDLDTGAIKAVSTVSDAAVDALRAGTDLVLIGGPERVDGARAAILAAARREEIPRSRLDEAAARVLELKRRLGLL